MSQVEEPGIILISRYSSRRLYNTHTSAYVTLDEIAVLINDGFDIQVVDKKTGDDLTRQILLQIITEHESRGDNVLPLNVLTDIVRSYSNKAQSFIPDFLAESFSAVKNRQAEMIGALQTQLPKKFSPQEAMEKLESWQQIQSGMLKSMIQPWMPKADKARESASEPDTGGDAATDQTSRDDDLKQMKKQLEQLQEKLKDL